MACHMKPSLATRRNSELLMDGERYERMYKIYLENKKIDEILDASESDSNSDYSDDY